MFTYTRVYTKAHTRAGIVYHAQETEYSVAIKPSASITVLKDFTGTPKTFRIGDFAEYDSYNLSYYGPIVAIGKSTVSIISRHDIAKHESGKKVKVHRLDLNKFCWRNYNFDLNKKSAENAETMMYI